MTDTVKTPPRPRQTPPCAPPGSTGARLQETANRLGLTQDRAAAYLGVFPTTYSKWVRGERQPGATVVRLLDVLGTIEMMAPSIHAALLPPIKETAK